MNWWKSIRSLLWAEAIALLPQVELYLKNPDVGTKVFLLSLAAGAVKVLIDWLTHRNPDAATA